MNTIPDPNRFPKTFEWLSAFDSELARTESESAAAAFASSDPGELLKAAAALLA